MDAEGAFFDNSCRADGNIGVHLLLWHKGFIPVEMASPVGTSDHAVPAPDTLLVVDDHDAIRFLPGGCDWTGLNTGRIVTLHTLDRHIPSIWLATFAVVQVSTLEINRSFLHSKYLDIGYAGAPANVVFFEASVDAFSASNTGLDINDHAVPCLGSRRGSIPYSLARRVFGLRSEGSFQEPRIICQEQTSCASSQDLEYLPAGEGPSGKRFQVIAVAHRLNLSNSRGPTSKTATARKPMVATIGTIGKDGVIGGLGGEGNALNGALSDATLTSKLVPKYGSKGEIAIQPGV